MANSMTGYGRSRRTAENYDITVEMKSVNHRYADFSIKLPRFCVFLEDDIKKCISKKVSRGKIDVFVTVRKEEDDSKEFTINTAAAKSLIDSLRSLSEDFGLKDDLTLSSVAGFDDIFEINYKEEDEDLLKSCVLSVLDEALDAFCETRKREGEKLVTDMKMRNDTVREKLEEIKKLEPQTVAQYRTRLEERIRELISDAAVDESRLLTETAIMADKLSITEEIVRLSSHLDEFERIITSDEPVGRRLDFLMQEMNRETNTIGSKSNSLEIARLVVDIKAELEKMREQLQNLE